MKQAFVVIFLVFFIACQSTETNDTEKEKNKSAGQLTEFEFNKEMHNFGELQSGETVVFTFRFTNTGENNLWINTVKTGCGCIAADFSKEPVKPGETGNLEVEFDSSGMYGKQMKSITVEANVPKPKHLAIFAEVKNEQLDIKY